MDCRWVAECEDGCYVWVFGLPSKKDLVRRSQLHDAWRTTISSSLIKVYCMSLDPSRMASCKTARLLMQLFSLSSSNRLRDQAAPMMLLEVALCDQDPCRLLERRSHVDERGSRCQEHLEASVSIVVVRSNRTPNASRQNRNTATEPLK